MKFMINCDEATTICDKNQYGEASLSEKIKLSFHLFICKYCQNYTRQNNILTRIFGEHLSPCEDIEELSEKEKTDLEKNLRKKIKKQAGPTK